AEYVSLFFLGGGSTRDLPAERQFHGHVIYFLKWELEIDRMYAVGMIKKVLLRSAKQSNRHQRSPAGDRCPSWNLQTVLCDQRRVRTTPIRLVCELEFNWRWHVFLHFVFQEFLTFRFVLISLFHASPHAFKSREGNAQSSLEPVRAFVEFEFC